jgi:ATP-dependent Clp protease ATP-binding subunit ClpC
MLGFAHEDGESQFEGVKGKLLDSMKKTFNPEFLNRLDDMIVFRPLDKNDMSEIVEILLGDFCKRLEVLHMKIDFSADSKLFLIDKGFDPALGARPLKRAIQRHLEDPLSELMLRQGMSADSEIHVDVKDGNLAFDVVSKSEKDMSS